MSNFRKLNNTDRPDPEYAAISRRRRLKHSRRKSLGKTAKVWIAVGATLAVLLTAAIITGVIYFRQNYHYDPVELPKDPAQLDIDMTIDWPEGITNIALFGIDSRSDNMQGLSDSIMIISVDAVHNSVKLISVMRDSLVKIDGYGYQKINAAYSFGGPQLAVKTLNKTFNLNIMDYATVDFVGMAEIIDAVGGVEVELTKYEVKCVNDGVEESARTRGTPRDFVSKSGVQTLSGVQAVAFSRIRKVATVNGSLDDFGRTERQRLVMTQLFHKALGLQLTQYPNLIKTMLPYVQTSLTYEDIYDLAMILLKDGITMKQDRIPTTRMIIDAGFPVLHVGSSVYYDLNYASKLIHGFIFDDISFDDYMEANGVEYNRWFTGKLSTDSSTQSSPEISDRTDSGTTTDVITDTDSENFESDFSGGGSGGTEDSSETTDITDDPETGDSDVSTDSSEAPDVSQGPSDSDVTDTENSSDVSTDDPQSSSDSSSSESSGEEQEE